MPFQSKAQARMMFAQKPAMAKEWAGMTPNLGALPEHVKAAVHKRLRRQGLRNEARHMAEANRKTPFKVPDEHGRGGPIQTLPRGR